MICLQPGKEQQFPLRDGGRKQLLKQQIHWGSMGRNAEILAVILFCTAVQLLTNIWLSGGPIPCSYGGETPALDRLTLLGVGDGL